jgi:hypothetical protein
VFLDRWAGEAIRCGWSDLDVFGCHDTAPTARRDAMGLVLLLDGCEIVAIDPDGADLVTAGGGRQRFYRRPLPHGIVSLWRLSEATILDAGEPAMAEPAETAPDAPRPASPQEAAAEERPRSGFAAVWGDASKGIDLNYAPMQSRR